MTNKATSVSSIARKAAFIALSLGLAGFASASEKIVIKGSDTLGAKLVPQLLEAGYRGVREPRESCTHIDSGLER